MANQVYPNGRTSIVNQEIDLLSDTVKIVAVDATYAFSTAHQYLTDLTGTLGTAQALTGKTINTLTVGSSLVGGIFDADDLSYAGVAMGDTVRGFVIYQDTGVAGTSRLVAYMNQENDGSSINVASTGAAIPVLWDNGPKRIFR